MSGNSIGTLFTVTTFGESHGPALGCIVDGCPPGLALCATDIQPELDRRRPGQSRHTTQRRESDTVTILSGVFDGLTTGTPIGMLVQNEDQRSRDYTKIKDLFRPGHADYTYEQKYGRRDYRGGGRASARETVMRVAAGAVARKWLHEKAGIQIQGWLRQLGPIELDCPDLAAVYHNPFFCADPGRLPELEAYMDALRKEGDSIGARINLVASGMPVGLGEPIFDRLEADIGKAMLSIGAVKAVEFGAGFGAVAQKGTAHRDEITPRGFRSNSAGGTLGGISSGQDLLVSIGLKPTSSIRLPAATIDKDGRAAEIATTGRHDPCVGLRATPIAEAMLAIVLMDHWLRHRAQNAGARSATPVVPASIGPD